MASVNVNRNLSDQFYRYKMPKIIAKVEGKGNGIKTVIVNMVEVAKALNRPPMYPTKYFGCILGAQVNCDLKNERYIVNGAHDSSKLQDLLDGFIQKYVLCSSCGNPETILGVIQKKGIITTSCKACGHSGPLNNRDKLTTYILKYPPTPVPNVGSSLTAGKKSRRKAKEEKGGKKQQNGDAGNGTVHGDSEEDTVDGAVEERDDEDWCEDTSKDAVAKRMENLSAGAKGLMLNDDLEKSPEDRLQMFFDYVKKKKEASETFDITLQKEIVAEAERLDIRDKAVLVLCELLFDEKMIQQIKDHRMLFLRFTAGNPKAQKYLLRAFELVVKLHRAQLMPRVAHILKTFYDTDIIDEKAIIEWGSKVYKKNVGKEVAEEIHEKAAPFLTWLKEAEEEEDSDEEQEEIEVVYDDRVRGNEIKIQDKVEEKPAAVAVQNNNSNNVNSSNNNQNKEEEEIDIDAI
ncbi:eukaryotic translation initiation factor 5-like protein [Dinothrombium tinctorium]|uniref:Eukaryotic translation initiation factor 5 n=1 Tax=Dinothrombium tinctorium TaxID=1965070 RepID=A0A3S3P8X1_9ACAR|nr:eukaryotic translation initiation factor 5-like protein [Dinothrombium tinctorium]RWS07790.1 eukaryotic translation initiation factor 5-like protein [Dinothrombium tinctorium]